MTVCRETGEIAAELLLTISCRSGELNPETGEWEKRNGRPFKIPQKVTPPRKQVTECDGKKCCGGAYVIWLALITLMMFAPSYGVTLWLAMETLYHLYAHKKPGMYQHPLHFFFFSEFCAYCQSKVRMDKVQRLQDRRYRHYTSNIPMVT
uniref:Uncharacterized protein n=1 Tax=Lygus hesperus TaxID=30085 RepID=A0A0A9WZI5_LYGHE